MATWVGKVTALASPLVEAIADHVMAAEKLHVDDTLVPVLAGFIFATTPVPPSGAAGRGLSLFSRSQGRASVRAARPLPRLSARRVFWFRAPLRDGQRAVRPRDRGRVLGAISMISTSPPTRRSPGRRCSGSASGSMSSAPPWDCRRNSDGGFVKARRVP
jgi:hypothetical protein